MLEQAQDNAGAAGQNAGQATSFKAGSETQVSFLHSLCVVACAIVPEH